MIRRKLLNFGPYSTDFRSGYGAIDELSKLLSGVVGRPRRALVVTGEGLDEDLLERVRHSVTDAGYRFDEIAFPASGTREFSSVATLLARLGESGITSEDMILGVGDARLCSLASLAGRLWCDGTAVALVPTALDAMVTAPSQGTPFSIQGGEDLVSLTPQVALVVCDLDLVHGRGVEENGLGYALMAAAHLTESRKCWEGFEETAAALAAGDSLALTEALSTTQNSRLNTRKSVSPSSRRAFMFGETAARALARCLGGGVPAYRLYAEGMRFEARLAVDACEFSVDEMFALDDRLEDLGIEELEFDLAPESFIEALRAVRHARSNRFQLALPKHPGIIRLASVDDELLERHARAFTASRHP